MQLHERLAIAAIVNGLRKSGAIDDHAVHAVADELRWAAKLTDERGQRSASFELRKLAGDVAAGKNGE
ncbi:hypothetical protein [uncultured Sphingomonas sp.]|uniref:hypothetical protein n=1 Tax=uncultured Sphingomonas sp. TaxID=158754 RepID=UPI0035CA3169